MQNNRFRFGSPDPLPIRRATPRHSEGEYGAYLSHFGTVVLIA
jgi:hypothetical protein